VVTVSNESVPDTSGGLSIGQANVDVVPELETLVSPAFRREVAELSSSCSGDDKTDQLLSRMDFERRSDLPSVEVRITVHGKDAVVCANAAAQTMVRLIPESKAIAPLRAALSEAGSSLTGKVTTEAGA
jgi:hypothetical protein